MFQALHSYSLPALEAASPNPSKFLFSLSLISLSSHMLKSANNSLKSAPPLPNKLLTLAAFPDNDADCIIAS